jgi:hypothetical protein
VIWADGRIADAGCCLEVAVQQVCGAVLAHVFEFRKIQYFRLCLKHVGPRKQGRIAGSARPKLQAELAVRNGSSGTILVGRAKH